MSDPSPNLTISWTSLEVSPSPFLFHTYFCPSDQRTLFQSSTVQCWYLRAKANLLFLWEAERRGFFFFTTAFREASLRVFLTVCEETGVPMMVLMKWVAWTAFLAFSVRILWTIAQLLVGESLEGQPPWWFSLSGWTSLYQFGMQCFGRKDQEKQKRWYYLFKQQRGVSWWKWGNLFVMAGFIYAVDSSMT